MTDRTDDIRGSSSGMIRDGLWERAKPIFDGATDLAPEDRRGFLSRECSGDNDLQTFVESLLDAHASAGDFLADPTIPADLHADEDDASERPGALIGPYRLVEKIGEGGFGVVYLAQQEQPVRRQVALKIIKPGMDSKPVIARFEAERQALAMMDHPNIARVFDAGRTQAGRPYFVMELVRGEPITDYCDRMRLSARERVALCVPVCQAVQHAHQKGVIHRDLKPANILVSLHDDRPMPKVIDFGIAKALHEPLTDATLMTEFRQFVGTPAYMSPEQAGRSDGDVDTRSDVYALGVLLYELLTGTTPFAAETLRSVSPDEVRRMIREVEPPRPSERISRMESRRSDDSRRVGAARAQEAQADGNASAHAAPNVATLRMTQPRELLRVLRGDLDWIVMKCLEKDRARRYDSAGDLARDLQRFLSDEPVSAGPPSAAYRLAKFWRRRRTVALASVITLVAIIGGLALSLAGFFAANRSRAVAESNAARAEAVREFLVEMLGAADPKVRGDPDLKVRALLDEAAVKLDAGRLTRQPEVEAALRSTIGRAYRELAIYEPGERELRRALELTEQLRGKEHVDVAATLSDLATLYTNRSEFKTAEPLFQRALEINRRNRGPDDDVLASNLNDLGVTEWGLGKTDEALRLLNEALAIARKPRNDAKPIRAETLNNLGLFKSFQAQFDAAEPLFREALAFNRRLLGDVHPNVATNLDNLASALAGRGDLAGAEAAYREALAIRRKVFPQGHPELATTLHNLGRLAYAKGAFDEAEKLVGESLAMFRQIHGLAHPDTQLVADSMVSLLGRRRALPDAEKLLLECYQSVESSPDGSLDRRRALAQRLSELYAAMTRPKDVEHWKAVVTELTDPKRPATPRSFVPVPATQPR